MMKDKQLYYLLDVVNKNGDAKRLVIEGIDFKAIGELTSIALEEGYLVFEANKIILTQKGLLKLETDAKKFKRTDKNEWILPALKSKVAKIDKNDIFLPSQDELTF